MQKRILGSFLAVLLLGTVAMASAADRDAVALPGSVGSPPTVASPAPVEPVESPSPTPTP